MPFASDNIHRCLLEMVCTSVRQVLSRKKVMLFIYILSLKRNTDYFACQKLLMSRDIGCQGTTK